MRVYELMGILQQCDPDDVVVMASDAEGNSYSLLADTNHQDYSFANDELFEDGDEPLGAHKAIVLWPY